MEDNLENLSKEQLIEKYKELKQEYIDLQQEHEDLQFDYEILEDDYSDLQGQEYLQAHSETMILDLDWFKNKLHLYDLDTEELLNFIDDYMRLYNKE